MVMEPSPLTIGSRTIATIRFGQATTPCREVFEEKMNAIVNEYYQPGE